MTAPLITVVGPTASGKSGLAVELAEQLTAEGAPGEVINADSMQFYRGMDIGTAKVTAEETRGVPHHLFDILSITEEAAASEYQPQARQKIAEIRARGKTPILVGGSGLYVRAAIDIIDFPPADAQVRAQLERELAEQGSETLRQELRTKDPDSEAVIRDDRRLIRALEVVRITGGTFTAFMPEHRCEPSVEPVVQIGTHVERPVLRERIEQRVHQMVEHGLLEEVRALEAQGLREGKTASRAIGYQQFLSVLDGRHTHEEAVEQTINATRKLARRQDTWFRADRRITWIPALERDAADQAMEVIAAAHG
ncbi:tRNA (adenosine(37)-N6)-dimethylallyltransferase MiaA [Nesterenkonia populi]|uniref:tRNA (adenosine(37)-N6)-dimethylallyltransferase MiaA n=1 Tax=Nesterenkonia populi TaxID=1591087 RepID=UPI0011BEA59F|nr:tRNA (adenosine(37)-N6)-dimethylallyltransferase MiaA [Nesterenkonia populi]